jgi:hypothetical protein
MPIPSTARTRRLALPLLLILTLLSCNFPPLVNRAAEPQLQEPNIVYVTATPEESPAITYEGEAPFDPNEMDSLPESAPAVWDVQYGSTLPLVSGDIGSAGGTLTVNASGGVLEGFTITVPAGAYESSTHFEVASATVSSFSLPDGLELITPVISIDNGGAEAAEFLQLTLPVAIPEGKFAMLFTWDPASGALDALPLLEIDSTHITALTTHFTLILGVQVDTIALDALNIQTGFKQGRNNWQFANYGSFIAPDGHCAGQSLMAMDYFVRFKGAPLFGKYDNFGNPGYPVSPDQQDDDRLAYRMCSVAQQRMNFENIGNKYWFNVQGQGSGYITYYSFAMALKASNEPQFISIFGDLGGHAMIVYGKYADRFYISDPNYPQANARRYVSYDRATGKFRPYFSGPNAADLGHAFPNIYYMNKYFRMNEMAGAALWAELEAGTVGSSWYPEYDIQYIKDLPDGSMDITNINGTTAFVHTPEVEVLASSTVAVRATIYNAALNQIAQIEGMNSPSLPLTNPLGTPYLFAIYGMASTNDWSWIDGRWVTFYRGITGTWHGAACAEAESNPYRWELDLNQSDDGAIYGDVYFHACPGGGAVEFSLSGAQKPGEDFATLTGYKTSGRGGLGNNTAGQIIFTVRQDQPPEPNLAP